MQQQEPPRILSGVDRWGNEKPIFVENYPFLWSTLVHEGTGEKDMAKFVFNIKGDVKESKEVGTIDRDKYQINTKEDEKQEKGKDDKKQDKKEK